MDAGIKCRHDGVLGSTFPSTPSSRDLIPRSIPPTLRYMKRFWVYIVASRKNGILYVGVTSDLARRAFEHREGAIEGFTRRHSVKRLVWYEEHPTAEAAIRREKAIKDWNRQWKIDLIEAANPEWNDLYLILNR